MKSSVLIATEVMDVHAVAVDLALREKGHDVVRLFGEDLPQKLTGTFTVDDDRRPQMDVSAPGTTLSSTGYDLVWYRRPCPPALPEGLLHADDVGPASQENGYFLDGIWSYLGHRAFWINPLGSRKRSRSKLLQLSEASRLGFKVPRTLVSNDPRRIREFIRANPPGMTIYKAFDGHFWDGDNGSRHINYTVPITERELPSDAMLQAVPGTFQRRIEKAFELRVTCFGRHAVAAKLMSQVHAFTAVDWRGVDPHFIPIEPFDLPQEVADRCWLLMQRLDLVFGCFDLIVTPEGDYVFLEVNEMGQFLWVEEVNPDIRLLDCMVDFIQAATPHFVPPRKAPAARLSYVDMRVREDFKQIVADDVDHHIGTSIKRVGPASVLKGTPFERAPADANKT